MKIYINFYKKYSNNSKFGLDYLYAGETRQIWIYFFTNLLVINCLGFKHILYGRYSYTKTKSKFVCRKKWSGEN